MVKTIDYVTVGDKPASEKLKENLIKTTGEIKLSRKQKLKLRYTRLYFHEVLGEKEKFKKLKNRISRNHANFVFIAAPERETHRIIRKKTGQRKNLPGFEYVDEVGDTIREVGNRLDGNSINFVTSPDVLAENINKINMMNALKKNKVPVPFTTVLEDWRELGSYVDHLGVVYIKNLMGSWGRGMVRIKKVKDQFWLEMKCSFKDTSHGKILIPSYQTIRLRPKKNINSLKKPLQMIFSTPKMIQEGIPTPLLRDGHGIEFKVDKRDLYVEKNSTITASAWRIAPREEIVTNISMGAKAVDPLDIFREGKYEFEVDYNKDFFKKDLIISKKARKSIPSGESGVDIIIDRRDMTPKVLEVNTRPYYQAGYNSGINPAIRFMSGLIKSLGFEDPFPLSKKILFEKNFRTEMRWN
jgi:glutathione synthase/RimK-type ligase-like ATP-grasp enzyme